MNSSDTHITQTGQSSTVANAVKMMKIAATMKTKFLFIFSS